MSQLIPYKNPERCDQEQPTKDFGVFMSTTSTNLTFLWNCFEFLARNDKEKKIVKIWFHLWFQICKSRPDKNNQLKKFEIYALLPTKDFEPKVHIALVW